VCRIRTALSADVSHPYAGVVHGRVASRRIVDLGPADALRFLTASHRMSTKRHLSIRQALMRAGVMSSLVASAVSSVVSIALTCATLTAFDLTLASGAGDGSHGILASLGGGETVGRLGLVALLATLLGSAVAGACAAKACAVWFGHVLEAPLLSLASTADRVAADRDYSARVPTAGAGELARPIDRVNAMLAEIQAHHAALRTSHGALEAQVEERTRAVRAKVGELRAVKQELAAAHDAVERANRAKCAFLTTMSHELQTPLHAIVGYGEMLAEEAGERGYGAAAPELREIVTAARHLSTYLGDVLDVSRGEDGRSTPLRQTFQPAQVLREAVTTMRPLAGRRGNALRLDIASELGSMWGDPIRLRQVLLNLVSNAATFTERGAIVVGVRRLQSDREDHCDWLEMTVSDTGAGLPPEQVLQFNAATLAGGPTTDVLSDSRPGLVISQRFSQLMGGRITAGSRPEGGSVFTVTVPASGGARVLAAPPVSTRPACAILTPDAAGTSVRI
jgi:signal transduction histidine kinase